MQRLSNYFKWFQWSVLMLACFLLASCISSPGNSSSSSSTNQQGRTEVPSTPVPTGLSTLQWCRNPVLLFRDQKAQEGAKEITDWNQVQSQLGFTIYLPEQLPTGTCLVSAWGTLNDSIFEGKGSFNISYLLPDQSSITFSQAPIRAENTDFQCNPANDESSSKSQEKSTPASSSNTDPKQLCSGVRDKTNIVMAAQGKTDALQQVFEELKPDVLWVPTK